MYFQLCLSIGNPLIAVFQANDQVTVETVNLVDSTGTVLQTIEDILILDDNSFATSFTPPSVLFYWQILGKYGEENAFSRISDTAIEVSDIDLTLGRSNHSKIEIDYHSSLLLIT